LVGNHHDEGVLAKVRDEERDRALVFVLYGSLRDFDFQPEGVEDDEVKEAEGVLAKRHTAREENEGVD